MVKGIFILNGWAFDKIYGAEEINDIKRYVDILDERYDAESISENKTVLKDIDYIFSGWGCPHMDKAFLDFAPELKVVFYGSGSVRTIYSDEFWNRGIKLTSSYGANAVPVAEFTVSQIIFCLKNGWRHIRSTKETRSFDQFPVTGAYGATVGIISLGMIGRLVCGMLRSYDLQVIAYDPYIKRAEASKLGVELCSLDDIFKRADVISCHTPWLDETEKMIKGSHFDMMKENSSFINTARGAVIDEEEMIRALSCRPDIQAVLDVTYPEPPSKDSMLYILPNVVLTPHIAGSMGNECRRMGRYMVDELERYISGKPLKWEITRQRSKILA